MTPLAALLAFAAWTLLLIVLVVLYRGLRIVQGTPINSWPRGNKPASDPPLVKRLEDAHANSLENLPVFAVIVLVAVVAGKSGSIAALAPWAFYARIGQSVAHALGTTQPLVFVRAGFWFAQVALFILMFATLARGFLA